MAYPMFCPHFKCRSRNNSRRFCLRVSIIATPPMFYESTVIYARLKLFVQNTDVLLKGARVINEIKLIQLVIQ